MISRCLAGCVMAATVLAVSTGAAATKPAPSALRLASAQCGLGYHLDVSGFCVDSMDRSRICPPGLFAIPHPNGNGFRCIPTEWMESPGWFSDLF